VSLYGSEALATRIHPPGTIWFYLVRAPVWEPNVLVRIGPVLLDRRHDLVVEPGGFVERSDDRNNVGVVGELLREGLDDSVCTIDSASLRVPGRVTNPMTRVVETVLTSGGAVKVNDDL